MGDTIEDMDMENYQKVIEMELLETRIGLSDSKVIEEMNRLGLNNHPKEKVIGLWIG